MKLKPRKAWALISKRLGTIAYTGFDKLAIVDSRNEARAMRLKADNDEGERPEDFNIIRVEIREVTK